MWGFGQGRELALTHHGPVSISPASALPRRLMVRLRTLTPSIEVRILAGHPTAERLRERRLPAGEQRCSLPGGHARHEAILAFPDAGKLLRARPDACRQSCKKGSAQRGGLEVPRPLDRE